MTKKPTCSVRVSARDITRLLKTAVLCLFCEGNVYIESKKNPQFSDKSERKADGHYFTRRPLDNDQTNALWSNKHIGVQRGGATVLRPPPFGTFC